MIRQGLDLFFILYAVIGYIANLPLVAFALGWSLYTIILYSIESLRGEK